MFIRGAPRLRFHLVTRGFRQGYVNLSRFSVVFLCFCRCKMISRCLATCEQVRRWQFGSRFQEYISSLRDAFISQWSQSVAQTSFLLGILLAGMSHSGQSGKSPFRAKKTNQGRAACVWERFQLEAIAIITGHMGGCGVTFKCNVTSCACLTFSWTRRNDPTVNEWCRFPIESRQFTFRALCAEVWTARMKDQRCVLLESMLRLLAYLASSSSSWGGIVVPIVVFVSCQWVFNICGCHNLWLLRLRWRFSVNKLFFTCLNCCRYCCVWFQCFLL